MSAVLSDDLQKQLEACEHIKATHWRPEMRLAEVELKNGKIIQCVFVCESDIRQQNDGYNLPWTPLALGHIKSIRKSKYAVPAQVQQRVNVMKGRMWSGEVAFSVKMQDGTVVDLACNKRDMWCFAELPEGYDWDMADEVVETSNASVTPDLIASSVCLMS
ncbi:hypothetical protein KS4_19830 [Poriferisphaera corsica]|uniref:Uncharacterized protein n=1 Tax=Poriferisphaera corsica TaxID=2528020 RepID=A0A517YUK0_9BACT|nr:hypothetical protein [Poriferisphaera corsica]QDU33923.1 hypothetical protein KS4_19830 [Poriferisphaera corsica]